jgi:hypothetical protein
MRWCEPLARLDIDSAIGERIRRGVPDSSAIVSTHPAAQKMHEPPFPGSRLGKQHMKSGGAIQHAVDEEVFDRLLAPLFGIDADGIRFAGPGQARAEQSRNQLHAIHFSLPNEMVAAGRATAFTKGLYYMAARAGTRAVSSWDSEFNLPVCPAGDIVEQLSI